MPPTPSALVFLTGSKTQLVVLAALLMPSNAVASTWLVEDFDCSNSSSFGQDLTSEWLALLGRDDPWSTSQNGGVSATADEGYGSYGSPLDFYENFLLTGHRSWTDYTISALIRQGDNDSIGLIARFRGANSYYGCWLIEESVQSCHGDGSWGPGTPTLRIVRADTTRVCGDAFTMASTPVDVGDAPFHMEFGVTGDTVSCSVRPASGTDGAVLSVVDPTPLASGLTGLGSFDNGSNDGESWFDDIHIEGFDPDTDGDGVSDAAELAMGTLEDSADTDGDGISDRDELGLHRRAMQTDFDELIDALDGDSDDDGLPDSQEAGDTDLATPPVDTDCDGIPDFRDVDSDGDGVEDGRDNCPTTANSFQEDVNSDGVGDACEGCDDRDHDGVCDVGDNCPGTPNPEQSDHDSNGIGDACDARDSDRDGLSDDEEREFGTDPENPDTDGDGHSDFEEVMRGSDPQDPASPVSSEGGTIEPDVGVDVGPDVGGDVQDDVGGDVRDDVGDNTGADVGVGDASDDGGSSDAEFQDTSSPDARWPSYERPQLDAPPESASDSVTPIVPFKLPTELRGSGITCASSRGGPGLLSFVALALLRRRRRH